MTSILAQQLQGIASLDADRITSHHGAPTGKSYLFTPKEAAALDLTAIYNIATTGFDELVELDPGMEVFEEELFSERSKGVDRMMLTQGENQELGLVIDRFLRRLSRWMLLKSAGKCLEWLIRRFRVHEFHVPALLHCFLPYHESQLFPRILSILLLKPSDPYYYLLKPLQKSPVPLSRELLLKYLSPQKDPSLLFLREVLTILPRAIEEGVDHRALYNFYTATLVDFIEKARNEPSGISEPVGRVLVEGFVTALCSESGGADLGPAVYPPLLLLVRSLPLSLPAYLPLLHVLPVHRTTTLPHRILTLLIVLEHAPHGFDGALGPQWEEFFLDGAQRGKGSESKREARMKEVEGLVVGVWSGVGLRKGWSLLLRWFSRRPEEFASIIGTMLAVPNLPIQLVNQIASEIQLWYSTQSSEAITDGARGLLDQIQQRYPMVASAMINGERKKVKSGPTEMDKERWAQTGPFVLAMSDDAQDRVHGCEKLIKRMLEGKLPEEERGKVKGILLDRLKDQDPAVLEAIYGGKAQHVTTLLGLITPDELLQALRAVFYDFATPRDVLLRHIRSISAVDQSLLSHDDVFQKVLFPLLVNTKARIVTVHAAWKVIVGSSFGLANSGILKGLGKVIAQQVEAANLNSIIADTLAQNIAEIPSGSAHLDFLVDCAGNIALPNQVRLFALLIISKALPLSPPKAASRAGSLLLSLLPASGMMEVKHETDSEAPLAAQADLLQRIYAKPSHEKTMAMMHAVVLAKLAALPLSEDRYEWLQAQGAGSATSGLPTALYTLANSTTLPAVTGASMLRRLFGQLKDDSLVFLAGIWTSEGALPTIRLAALRHGKAFMSACLGADDLLAKDFQLLIPSLLFCLTDFAHAIRHGALELLSFMAAHAPLSQLEPFALDTFYGEASQGVKILEHGHVKQYLVALVNAASELRVDSNALVQVHARLLNASHGEGKKQAAFRREVIYVLGTHIMAWRHLPARMAILKAMSGVKGSQKLDMLSHLVVESVETSPERASWLSLAPTQLYERYIVAVIGSLDAGVAKLVSRGEPQLLNHLLDMLKGPASTIVTATLSAIRISVYEHLSVDWQIKVMHKLLDGVRDVPEGSAIQIRGTLKQLNLSVYGLIQILNGFAEAIAKRQEPVQKRSRQDAAPPTEVEEVLSSLMTFLESRELARMPESAALMTACLSLLSETMQYQEDVATSLIDYLQQTLLVILTNTAKRIRNPASVIAEALSVETVIRLIRGASNPRTSQQALLFIGSLAKLTPEAVLHNVMPIFTYIGSNDFQKDDAHSFAVVERTVESIVPIMVDSARADKTSELDLLRRLHPLLRIFADMAGRLPSHRTVPFFSHLVETLGASDFLAATVMVLSDRAATKSARTGAGPSTAALALPLALLRTQSVPLQITAVASALDEVKRLLAFALNAEQEQPFLEPSNAAPSQEKVGLLYARALTLMAFSRQALPSKLGSTSRQAGLDIANQLLQLSATTPSVDEHSFADPIRQLASQMLNSVLSLLPVPQFLELSTQVLRGSSSSGVNQILELLQARVPLIQPVVREGLTESFATLLPILQDLIGDRSRDHTVEALEVYSRMIRTSVAAEDAAVAQGVPILLAIAKSQEEVILSSKALDVLIALPKRLSTRMIPFIKSILDLSLGDFSSPTTALPRTLKAIDLASQLISAVPGFLPDSSLKALLFAIFALPHTVPDNPINTFFGVVSKRMATQTVFDVISEIWLSHTQAGEQTLTSKGLQRFFVLVQRAIRSASRSSFQPIVRGMFSFFLAAFDLSRGIGLKEPGAEDNMVEAMVIEAFLDMVEKLNEQAFRPLFARTYDWAFIDAASSSTELARGRQVAVFKLLDGLIEKFKTIMTPYIGVVFEAVVGLLDGFAEGKEKDVELWTSIVTMLGNSFTCDDGGFWTTETLDKIVSPLGKQFPVVLRLSSERASSNPTLTTLSRTLTSLAVSTTSDTLLKSLNSSLLLVTRSETPQVRVAALIALQGIWAKQEEMVQFVPETVAQFLSELLEDESTEVEAEARKLLGRIEGLVGDLSSYLE